MGLYVIITFSLVILCALLALWVFIKEKKKPRICQAMVKICRTCTTTPKSSEEDVANVEVHSVCAESTRGQSTTTEILRETAEPVSRQMVPLVLELANVPPRD